MDDSNQIPYPFTDGQDDMHFKWGLDEDKNGDGDILDEYEDNVILASKKISDAGGG